ncbi:hypothetical protein BC938DRAFT_479202 [Jimgerdemannia flammicorona]|uniref:Uncharacterized protein n=1 Tax=Jimgerdemannia flammicorona TaxID=994334 RepID=A0A433QLE6_9FUNG|nr:hypothetical protein BC938DRAFT_479202 [Jimgerdemannia flammicorona]
MHPLSEEFKYSDIVTDGTELSSISFVTPLKATVARFFMETLNDAQPLPINNIPLELKFKDQAVNYPLPGELVKNLEVVQHPGPPKECRVKISGFKSHSETVDIEKHLISIKHASRYLQFAGKNYRSRVSTAYEKALKLGLESAEILLVNEVEFGTKTSTFGHMVRNPSTEAASYVKTVLKHDAYRPMFYDNIFWDRSALIEALDVGNFVEDIVRYCLKDYVSKEGGLLEPGYVAIVVGALPTISRKSPELAALIAQYLSHIQLDRFIAGFPVTGEFRDGVFGRVEQLSNYNQSPLRDWWLEQRKAFSLWWNA